MGHDQLCRAAAIRTSKGHTTRSLVKLVPVELNILDDVSHKPIDNENPVDSNVSECRQRIPGKAARTARDMINAQLIDLLQD